jgi:hypothetical protein
MNGVVAPGGRVQEVAKWAANEFFKQKKKYFLHSTKLHNRKFNKQMQFFYLFYNF